MKIKFFTVGGTIDKIYFDRKNDYQVGESRLSEILQGARVGFTYDCESLLKKDSLDITDEDRRMILETISREECRHIVITHGTDTMVQTAKRLRPVLDKTIVLTGSMEPARFRSTRLWPSSPVSGCTFLPASSSRWMLLMRIFFFEGSID